jgi:hypothetical protein
MLGEQPRPVAVDQTPQAGEMRAIEAVGRADRQADPMKRKRVAGANLAEHVVRWPAVTHVVFGVNLEEMDCVAAGQHVVGMLMFEPDPDAIGGEQRPSGIIGARLHGGALEKWCGFRLSWAGRRQTFICRRHVRPPTWGQLRLIGSSEPVPAGVVMVVQVPLGTSRQALPW